VGDTHEATATIENGTGNPVSGIPVIFTVISGPNQGETGSDTTDQDGKATFSYTGDGGIGTDEIQACFTYEDNTVCSQTVTKVWNQTIVTEIVLDPSYALNLDGESHTVTATITPTPPSGTSVTFTVISGPNQGETGSDTTDQDGKATFSYTGDGGVGTDRVQVCFYSGATELCSNVVEKEWTKEIITLDPTRDTNPLDTQHTVTATVTDLKGTPIPGITVSFVVKLGPNVGDSGTDTTDSNGEATFTYTGDGGVGTDAIRACFTNAAGENVCTDYGDTIDDDAIKQWQQGEEPVCPAMKPNPADLPSAVINVFYTQTMTGYGGEEPYTFAVTDGALPPDLTLDPVTGILSGTPTAGGSFAFKITVTDSTEASGGCTGSRAYIFLVCPGISITPVAQTLPIGMVGIYYHQIFSAGGGEGPYSYQLTGGAIPDGLSLSAGSLVLSGLPASAGTWNFTITAHDEGGLGCSVNRNYTIQINRNAIPTLSEWGTVIFALLTAGMAIVFIRRRKNRIV